MDGNELKKILKRHLHWLKADCFGWEAMRADLRGADLRGADLSKANLRGANLRGANLSETCLWKANLSKANLSETCLWKANLSGTDLSETYLWKANLSGTDLCEANLRRADLCEADLNGACLKGADLNGACLEGANLSEEQLSRFFPICCPEYGAFIGWKTAYNRIIKLEICEDAKRSSAFGRKCRASKARCLAIENLDGHDSGLLEIGSQYDEHFVYRVGKISEVKNFDEDRTRECAPGIHFFITRQEAVNHECY